MFGGSFNRLRYNLGKQQTELPIRLYLNESVRGYIYMGKDMRIHSVRLTFNEALRGRFRVYIGVLVSENFAESLRASVKLNANIVATVILGDSLHSNTQMRKDIYLAILLDDSALCSAYLSKNIRYSTALHDILHASVTVFKDIRYENIYSDIVSCTVSTVILEQQEAIFNVTLLPGQRIIFDTENFNLLLGNENIIHLHSGDWITLERRLVDIVVDSGTGGTLTGSIIYKERYL